MDTAGLKRFATEARTKLISLIGSRLTFILTEETADLKAKEAQILNLREQITKSTQQQVIETAAYIWFNRFIALRFMDVNGYTNPRVLTPAFEHTVPEILQEAKSGNFSDDLAIDRDRVLKLLDGKIQHPNPQGEAYRMLIVASCNAWGKVMPFLFERIEDWTELLIPGDLLSENSIIADVRNSMNVEDCQQEEIIGWLYQFYIFEKKEQVFAGLKKNQKITAENIPAATQLFTPHWIVRYLVENSLGKLWLQMRPSSNLRAHMPYYIEQEPSSDLPEGIKTIKDITFLDPCAGSGHILVYAFELFCHMYEEEGFDTHEIPDLILKNNLFGLEIDDRAAALAGFALCMKSRSVDKRFFKRGVLPNVVAFQNITFKPDELNRYMARVGINVFTAELAENLMILAQAKNFGSLIQPSIADVEDVKHTIAQSDVAGDVFLSETHSKVLDGLEMIRRLQKKYACVVTNPPYMGSKGMNAEIRAFAEERYPNSKSDLFAMFIERNIEFAKCNGYSAAITMESWMFLSTYEDLRSGILNKCIVSMIHMPYLGKGGTSLGINFGTSAAIFHNINNPEYMGRYYCIRHFETDGNGVPSQFPTINERTATISCNEFKKIPGSPVAYWVKDKLRNVFISNDAIAKVSISEGQNITAKNSKYLRFAWEVSRSNVNQKGKWRFYAKGGAFRRWWGNLEWVIDWSDDAKAYYRKDPSARLIPEYLWYKEGITWTLLSSTRTGFRFLPAFATFDKTGSSIFFNNLEDLKYCLAICNSAIAEYILSMLSSTIAYQVHEIRKIPFLVPQLVNAEHTNRLISISKDDWDSFETSWEFSTFPFLASGTKSSVIALSYNAAMALWSSMTSETKLLEEENNRILICEYGLENELKAEVSTSEISLNCNPAYRYGPGRNQNEYESLQKADTIRELLSYCVGVLFGRYSLDKPGLILANAGETTKDYITQVFGEGITPPDETLLPDDDAIIPILDDEYFADDIVNRTKEFLSKAFAKDKLNENIRFIEDAIGKDLRKFYAKDFYPDHIKRYKKRPIYWMFASPNGTFRALIYMHRYKSDTLSQILSNYLRPLIEKLKEDQVMQNRTLVSESATQMDKTRAQKRLDKIIPQIEELEDYEQVLYRLAAKRIDINLDDGVRVNYPKFAPAIMPIKGLESEED